MGRCVQLLVLILGIGLAVSPVHAQDKWGGGHPGHGGGNQSCPSGTYLLAKFENKGNGSLVFEKPLFYKDEVSIDDVDLDSEGEIAGVSWSSKTRVGAAIVKGGPGSEIVTFSPIVAGSTLDNSKIGGKEISNLKFCAPKRTLCDTPTLGDDVVDENARTVSNTMQDQEGITGFAFFVLDNFTVTSITPSSGFLRLGNLWIWTANEAPPTTVDFTLQAEGPGKATYFLKASDDCLVPKITHFDPVFHLKPVATTFDLEVPYPNPTQGPTTLRFSLVEARSVRLAVYDVMGRRVATLVDGTKSPGIYEVRWNGEADDGRRVASGLYLVRLQAGAHTATRRVTLVR